MVGFCVAPICPNQAYPRRNISYFHFPNPSKHPQLHSAWLQAIGSEDFKPTKNSRICEFHFNEDDFDETYKMKRKFMPGEYFRPILKPDAVPKLQVQRCEISKSDKGEKMKILTELLGESYLNWKYKVPEKDYETEKKEATGQKCLIKEEKNTKVCFRRLENGVGDKQHKLFDITTDYILKKPLKPLPEALQRILPSILKVVIKEAPDKIKSERATFFKDFCCTREIPINQFYQCKFCNFTSFLKVSLVKHTKISHLPMKRVPVILRQPMKICKPKEPKRYWCECCGYRTFSRFLFLKHSHEKGHHSLELINVGWFLCKCCVYKCRKSGSLIRHMLNKHSKRFAASIPQHTIDVV